ncbi:uncharacterized protein AKAME5_000904900, partial [Lates japonicus]
MQRFFELQSHPELQVTQQDEYSSLLGDSQPWKREQMYEVVQAVPGKSDNYSACVSDVVRVLTSLRTAPVCRCCFSCCRCRCSPPPPSSGPTHKANSCQQRNSSLSVFSRTPRRARGQSPEFQRNREAFPASVDKLRQLIEDKVHVLQSPVTENHQGNIGRDGLWRFVVLSEELTFDLQQLQRQTEQELSNIQTQRRRTDRTGAEEKLQPPHRPSFQLCSCQELQASIAERSVQSEGLVFQEEALHSLHNLLTQDLHRYREEIQRLTRFTQRVVQQSHRSDGEETFANSRGDRSMQGKNETEQNSNMRTPESSPTQSPLSPHQTTNGEEADQAWASNLKKTSTSLSRSTNLRRAGSVKELINKFSGPDQISPSGSPVSPGFGIGRALKSASVEVLLSPKSGPSTPSSVGPDEGSVPSITVTPPLRGTNQNEGQRGTKSSQITARIDCPVGGSAENTDSQPSKTQTTESGRDSVADSGMGSESEFDSNKPLDSPLEEEPSTPRATSTTQNPKYQLFLNNEHKTNGLSGRDTDGPGGSGSVGENGPRLARWETNRLGLNHYKGSLESLASRDWDTMSDRFGVDSPPRVFNSPYTTAASMDYNPMYRMSEFKVQGGLSPSTSEMNLYSFNSRSTSPVGIPTPTLTSPRPRFSAYDTLVKRRAEVNNTHTQVVPTHYSMRSATLGAPNRKDYIEELTKQLDACQK